MESGYTRKKNRRRKEREAKDPALPKAAQGTVPEDRVHAALPAKPGPKGPHPAGPDNPMKGLNTKTKQAIIEARGEKLAVERLREIADYLLGVASHYRPLDGKGHLRKQRDYDRWKACIDSAANTYAKLAPFQSPKLQAILMQKADDGPTEEIVRITVDIFDDTGKRVERLVDGKTIEGEVLDEESNLANEESDLAN